MALYRIMLYARLLCLILVCHLTGIGGQNTATRCDITNGLNQSQRRTCRLGGCYSNEERLPGGQFCQNVRSPLWAVFLCVDNSPCCSRGGNCRNVCAGNESPVNTTTDCTASGTRCCIRGEDREAQGNEVVARKQGACGRLAALGPRIIGGRVNQPRDWPWMVRLLNPARPDERICAGVLVDDDTVLTVAHCVLGVRPQDLNVLLGDFDITETEPEEELADVISVEINPNFVQGTRGNDFAVIKLARPVTFSPRKFPACLPDPDIPIVGGASVIDDNFEGRLSGSAEDNHCFIAGWGRTEDGQISPKLRTANVRLMDAATCNAVLSAVSGDFTSSLPSDVICTNTAATNTGACTYDDGGMLVCLDIKHRYSLLGLVSQYSCERLPTIYTRVSNYTLPVISRL